MSGPVCGKVSKVRRPNKRSPWFSEEPEFRSGRLNCESVIRRCGAERSHRQNVYGFTSGSVYKYRCAPGTFVFNFNVILIFILIYLFRVRLGILGIQERLVPREPEVEW